MPQDRVDRIALHALEEVPSEQSIAFHMADLGLDGCAPAQMALERVGKLARATDQHPAAFCGYRNSHCAIPENGLPRNPLIHAVVVSGRFDAADDWIVEQVTGTDIAITSDIPLAARCLGKRARVLDPKGRLFTEDSIGDALASREISAFLRDMGETGGGPKPYEPKDRSRFLGTLENQIQALLKLQRGKTTNQG